MTAASWTAVESKQRTARRVPAIAGVAAGLAPAGSSGSGATPEALPGWLVELPLPEAARLLLAILWRWRVTKRFVNPSVTTLSKMLGRTPRTVQRYLALLEGRPSAHEKGVPRPARQYVVRVYNAGRGRQCLYYLVPPGKRPHGAPAWPSTSNFGGLRMGRFAIKRHHPETLQNPDHKITLTGHHTSCDQRVERETKSASAIRLPEVASPQSPPAGGTPSASASPPKHAAQPPRLVFTKPIPVSSALWRTAWAQWRQAHRDYFRIEPFPDVRDGRAMLGLIEQAERTAKQNRAETLRVLVWGFRRHCRAAGAPRNASLCNLRRVRHEYGWPKPGWIPPAKPESLTSSHVTGATSQPSTPAAVEQGSWEEKELRRYRAQLAALEAAAPGLISPRTLDALRRVIAKLQERIRGKRL
jgi:hypothetical protein